MKECKYCGHQNWSDDDFCAECGKVLESANEGISQDPPKQHKSGTSELSYLVYWVIGLIIGGIIIAILYFFFGFWIEIITFIIMIFVIFGFISTCFVALLEWMQENKELKTKRQLFKGKTEKMEEL